MKIANRLVAASSALALVTMLGACANSPWDGGYEPVQGSSTGSRYARSSGEVVDVRYMRRDPSSGIIGAVAGGAVGGLLGSQVGGGSGRTAATVAGVVGGALIGNALEHNMGLDRGQPFYRVKVRMSDGSMQDFDFVDQPNVRIGERVRVEGNQLYRR